MSDEPSTVILTKPLSRREIDAYPIIFSASMIRAIQEGRKSQTRRVIRPQPPGDETVRELSGSGYGWMALGSASRYWQPTGPVSDVRKLMGREPRLRSPYGQPGDTLWVRETWATRYCTLEEDGIQGDVPFYRADYEDDPSEVHWRPSIHMPRWAARLFLGLNDIRVEPVQAITPEDCLAEGVLVDCPSCTGKCWHWDQQNLSRGLREKARRDFRSLWNSINAKRGYGWDANPWVWVLTFALRD